MAKLRDWTVDYLHVLKGRFTVYRRPPVHYQQQKVGKKAVILLAGLALKWQFLRYLGNRISLAGHAVYVVPDLRRNHLGIEQSAKLVRALIEQYDLKQVVIVGHSKGGLIGKCLLMHHNQDKRIRTIIAIASPFSGSSLARVIPRKSFKEITPLSKIIQRLQANTVVNSKIISIIPEFDNYVWAEQGSYLPGARNINVKVRGHHKVVFDKQVGDTIIKLLEEV